MNIKKCSFKKHENIEAISYCIECKVFMCNKCLNHHDNFLESHHKFNLNQKIEEIFTGICEEEGHKNELEYFVKLIINYVVLLVFAKLKLRKMVIILIVIFVQLMKLKMEKKGY